MGRRKRRPSNVQIDEGLYERAADLLRLRGGKMQVLVSCALEKEVDLCVQEAGPRVEAILEERGGVRDAP